MWEINIWISGLKPSFLRWAAFDICLLIQRCFTFLLLSKLFLFVWWMMKAFIPYNDNKHYLFSTYYLARSCGVYFIYIISFQFSEEPFEACIVPHSTVDKAELRKAVVKGPEFTLGSDSKAHVCGCCKMLAASGWMKVIPVPLKIVPSTGKWAGTNNSWAICNVYGRKWGA